MVNGSGEQNCSGYRGHMATMAATSIYGDNPPKCVPLESKDQ